MIKMLPDFPKHKAKIRRRMVWWAQLTAKAKTGVLIEIAQNKMQEGDEHWMIREDGTEEKIDIQSFSATRTIDYSDVSSKPLMDVFSELVDTMSELTDQQMFYLIETIHEVTKKTGNVVEAGGKPVSLDLIFKTLETMQIDFDEEGNPQMPTFFVAPEMAEKLKELNEQFEQDPEAQKRHNQIIEQKRHEWRHREASRKLVG